MTYLSIHNLDKTFTSPGGAKTKALQQVSLDLDKGKILSVIGHNGSGKTTLLNCIRRYSDYDSGEILINGRNIQKSLPRVVSVHQDVDAGVVGSMSTMDCLGLVMSDEPSFLFSFPGRKYRNRIFDFLNSIGLAERFSWFERTRVADLSGGQRQQLAIVMAMLRRPELLLLDEFVANLDPAVSADILDWLKKYIHEKRITTIMVTHDHGLAESWGDHVLELSEGRIIRFSETANSGGTVH
jgi:putative ABC transport system ATP-binding protein